MNLNFILNEYILMWDLLFKKSISKSLNEKKQKIWINYKKQYRELQGERINILNDSQNYIPTDDTIYNIIKEEIEYQESFKNASKYKSELNRIWNIEKKKIIETCLNITKIDIRDYDILILDSRFLLVDYLEEVNNNVICYGTNIHGIDAIIDIIYNIYLKETLYQLENDIKNKNIIYIILEFLLHEMKARIMNENGYNFKGDLLREKIYLCFLMYLGIKADEIEGLFVRNGISFDKSLYNSFENNKYLYKKNLYVFIKYCDEYFYKNNVITYDDETISIKVEEII